MIPVTKQKTQAEKDAAVARFRMLSAAMESLSQEEQIGVIEDAMKEGRMPVPAQIDYNA